jgi:CNT family concentrative nucleoside transporter
MERLVSLLGMVTLLGIAFLLSNNRRAIRVRTVATGIALQLGLGVLLLWWQPGNQALRWFAGRVYDMLMLSQVGVHFLFGQIGNPDSAATFGPQIALTIVSIIIFFSALTAIFYYLGILQRVVEIVARFMRRTMKTSGAESLACAAEIFLGHTESPLLIRPYLEKLTQSELFTIMVGGLATIAGSVMASYMSLGVPAPHLMAASVMSAPAALVIAKIMFPETAQPVTSGEARLPKIKLYENLLDAAAKGTTDGLKLALNVIAMLISFLALLALADWILGGLDALIDGRLLGGVLQPDTGYSGIFPGRIAVLFGTLFRPLAFLLGVPWSEAATVGHLLGVQLSANEFVSYIKLSELIKNGALSERAVTIATYSMCGFANFGSVGIQLGGIGALAPGRRSDLARLGLKALIGGALASYMTGTVAGLLIT